MITADVLFPPSDGVMQGLGGLQSLPADPGRAFPVCSAQAAPLLLLRGHTQNCSLTFRMGQGGNQGHRKALTDAANSCCFTPPVQGPQKHIQASLTEGMWHGHS